MRQLPPMSCLRAFEAAARVGSFKQAAEELFVTPTAISHRIRLLEEYAGLPLFLRQARKVSLTEAGAQLFPVLQEGLDAFEAVLARLRRTPQRETVTISATSAFTAKWLVPRVARFHAQHPNVDLQLHASDVLVDLKRHGVDMAVRYGAGPYPDLHAEPLFTDAYAPMANPMLNVHTPADLKRVPLIHFEWQRRAASNPTWLLWFANAGLTLPDAVSQWRYSDEAHAVQAAVAGQGVALLSVALVADELSAGHLVQPFGPALVGFTYHLVMRAAPAPRAAVSLVADWLKQEAMAFQAAR